MNIKQRFLCATMAVVSGAAFSCQRPEKPSSDVIFDRMRVMPVQHRNPLSPTQTPGMEDFSVPVYLEEGHRYMNEKGSEDLQRLVVPSCSVFERRRDEDIFSALKNQYGAKFAMALSALSRDIRSARQACEAAVATIVQSRDLA